MIKRLNPIIRGWAAYYRTQVSSETFSALDNYLWRLTYKWAKLSHPNKPKHWVISRYFGRFNKSRHDRWVFGDRQSGAYIHKFAWTTIVRHQMVKGGASPDDPALTEYWARRRRKTTPADQQHHACGSSEPRTVAARSAQARSSPSMTSPQTTTSWEQWLATTRTTIIMTAARTGTSDEAEPRLIHADCRHRHGRRPALLPANAPPGLA